MIKFLSLLASLSLGTAKTSFLTPDATQTVIQEIDSICADSWCAGDLNYGFDQLVCDDSECYLDIRAITRNDNGLSQSRPYRCELKGFQAASDLLQGRTYSDKLYDAVSRCIQEEVPRALPIAYVPKASACLQSLRQKSSYKSASHSVYAEIFYELDNKAQASARVLNEIVTQYASTDRTCALEYFMVFEDQIACERVGGAPVICSVPTDTGRFSVIKDYVDGAAVIYIEGTSPVALGTLNQNPLNVKLAQPENCSVELLNLDGKQSPQKPFNSSDHHSYFVSAKSLNPKLDARVQAAQLVQKAVSSVQKTSRSCAYKTAATLIEAERCKTLGGIQSCVLSAANGGYYVVTRDWSDGAFVTFIRYD